MAASASSPGGCSSGASVCITAPSAVFAAPCACCSDAAGAALMPASALLPASARHASKSAKKPCSDQSGWCTCAAKEGRSLDACATHVASAALTRRQSAAPAGVHVCELAPSKEQFNKQRVRAEWGRSGEVARTTRSKRRPCSSVTSFCSTTADSCCTALQNSSAEMYDSSACSASTEGLLPQPMTESPQECSLCQIHVNG